MSVGGIATCLITGPLTDRFGRRSLYSIGAALVVAIVIIETSSTGFTMFTSRKDSVASTEL